MSNSFNTKKVNFIINFVYIFIIIIVFYIVLKYALPIVFPIVISFLIANFAEPTVYVLAKQTKIKRSVCSFVTILFIVVLVFSIISVLSILLFTNIEYVINQIPIIFNRVNAYFIEAVQKQDKSFIEKAVAYGYNLFNRYNFDNSKVMSYLVDYITSFVKSIPSLLFSFFITLILSVFISSSLPEIKNFIKTRFSANYQKLLHCLKTCSFCLLKSYFKSYILIMLITFCELTVAFLIFKINPAITLALTISIVDVLPVFGVGTVMVPWGVILMLCGDFSKGIVIIAIYVIITTVRQIIEPKIISQSIGLPAVITLPLMFIGIKLFGVIGLFLLPMIVTVVYDLYKRGCFDFFVDKTIKKI